MKKQVLAASAALFLSVICLGAMRAVPAKAAAQETAAVAIGGTAIVYKIKFQNCRLTQTL